MPTFGKTAIGATKNSFPAPDTVSGSVFPLTTWGLATSASVYFEGTNAAHEGGLAKVQIYTVGAAGLPLRLVAQTSEVSVPDNINGWIDFPFAPSITLLPASYMLSIMCGTRLYGAMDTLGSNYFRVRTYASGPEDPLGSLTTSTQQKSIYITYTTLPAQITVATWNVAQTGDVSGVAAYLKSIAPNLDVVVFQELIFGNAANFELFLNSTYGVNFDRVDAQHCDIAGAGDTCTLLLANGPSVMSRWPILSSDVRWLKYDDDFGIEWRAVIHTVLNVNGQSVNVFSIHAPAGSAAQTQANKLLAIQDFKPWAETFTGKRIVGGDFNAHGQPPTHKATHAAILEMLATTFGGPQAWLDSWASVGTGTGTTRSINADRIDFLFSQDVTPTSSFVGNGSAISDHYPVVSQFSFDSPPLSAGGDVVTTVISLSFPITLVQNTIYALPTKSCRLFCDTAAAAFQQSNTVEFTANVAVTLVDGQATLNGGFIRSTAGNALVMLKEE